MNHQKSFSACTPEDESVIDRLGNWAELKYAVCERFASHQIFHSIYFIPYSITNAVLSFLLRLNSAGYLLGFKRMFLFQPNFSLLKGTVHAISYI